MLEEGAKVCISDFNEETGQKTTEVGNLTVLDKIREKKTYLNLWSIVNMLYWEYLWM